MDFFGSLNLDKKFYIMRRMSVVAGLFSNCEVVLLDLLKVKK